MIKSTMVQERIMFRQKMKHLREKKGEDKAFMNFVLRRYLKFMGYSAVGRHKQLAKLVKRKEAKMEFVYD